MFVTLSLVEMSTIWCLSYIQTREAGKRLNIIIVAEGARDVHGNEITASQVTQVCNNKFYRI